MSEERKTIYLCLAHTVVDGFNIIFGTHLVRIFEAKIHNFLLVLLKIAMISWFHALFGTHHLVRRFESLLSDNDYIQPKRNYHLFVQCFDDKSLRLFPKNIKITHI